MYVYKNVKNRVRFKDFSPPCFIEDIDGKRRLDLHSGAGAFFFGYPSYENLPKFLGGTNFFSYATMDTFLSEFEKITRYKCPILLCSGSEANEAAIKLALKASYGKRKKIGFLDGCYFGRTYFAAMASPSPYNDFLGNDERFVKVNTTSDIDDNMSCFIFETYPSLSLDWNLKKISEIVKKANELGIVTICDDTKGAFRTGSLFSFADAFRPSMVTMSKSLASGFPMSAVLVDDSLLEFCDENWYTTTTGGHPLGIMLAQKNLKHFSDIVPLAQTFIDELYDIFGQRVKARGRYISIEKIDGIGLSEELKQHGVLVYPRKNFISLFPNCLMDKELDILLEALKKVNLYRFFL